MPNLYVISGCNGAGKTTASFNILPDILECYEFVNADEIAKGLSPFNPEKSALEAGRLMLTKINGFLEKRVDFAFETTLATKSYKGLIERAKLKGYKVTLLFFWLKDEELAIERVKLRVFEGGHDIPTDVIRRRYKAGVTNFFDIYSNVVDEWFIFDNTYGESEKVAQKVGLNIEIIKEEIFTKIKG